MATQKNVIENSAGSVGIGTTSPTQVLELKKSTGSAIALLNYNDSVKFNINASSAGVGYVGMVSNHPLLFVNNDTERMRLDTSGNLGIGTSNPVYKLQVSGQTFLNNGTSNALQIQTSVADTTTRDAIYFYEDSGAATGRQAISWYNGNVSYYKARLWTEVGQNYQATQFGIDVADDSRNIATRLAIRNGNVGIGSTSPACKLDVAGTIRSTSSEIFGFGASDNVSIRAASSANVMGLYTSNSEKVRIDSNGNVGIGTTSPTSILHAYRGAASSNVIALQVGDNTNTLNYIPYTAAGGYNYASVTGGSALFNSINSTWWIGTHNGPAIRFTPNGTMSHINSTGTITLYVSGSGNVGINQTSPAYKLDVNGTGRFAGDLYSNGNLYIARAGANLFINGTNSDAELHWQANGTSRWAMGMNVGDGTENLNIYNYTTSTVNFSILKANGNVGIGNASPTAKLDIASTQANGIVMRYDTGVSYQAWIRPYWNSGTDTRMDFAINRSANVTPTVIMSVGYGSNVGIGTTAPAYKLDVVSGSMRAATGAYAGELYFGTVDNENVYLKRDNNYDLSLVQNAASGNALYLASAGNVYISIDSNNNGTTDAFIVQNNSIKSGTELFRVQENGNVGIGTSSPGYKLQVNGTALATTVTDGSISLNGGDLLFAADGGGNGFQFDYYNTKMYIGNNAGSTWYMGIQDDGNVGIGTTSPIAKFVVNNNGGTTNAFYVDLGNRNDVTTLFEHTGTTTPVPFRLKKSGYSGTAANYGLLYLYMNDGTVGNGSNLYFTLNDSAGNEHEYGGLGAHVITNTNGAESGDLVFYTSDAGTIRSEKVRIKYNGNVGIGTSSPSSKLHIDDINAPWITISRSGTPTWQLRNNYPNNQYGFSFNNTTAGTVPLFIGAGGNVGIGLDNPAYKLEIGAGSTGNVVAKLTQGYEKVRYYGFDLLGYNDGNLWMIGNNAQNGLILGSNWDWDAQVGIYYTPGTYGAAGGTLEIGQLTKNNANYTHGNTRFYTNGTERMRIISTGNVGIGTTSPGVKLQTYATNTGAQILMSAQDAVNSLNFGLGYSVNSQTFATIAGYYTNSAGSGAGDLTFYTKTTVTSLTEKMRIQADGNVGIGTNSPVYKLDVNGSINASTFMYATYPYGDAYPLQLIGSSFLKANNNYYGLLIRSGDTNFISGRLSLIGGSSKRFEIHGYEETVGYIPTVIPGGNLGIGTTSPAFKLDVNGAIGVGGLRFLDLSTNYFRIFEPAGNIAIYLGNAADPANYYDNTTHVFRNRGGSSAYAVIEGNGNLGIGTSSVTEAIHVYRAANSIIRLQAGGGNVSGVRMDDASSSGYLLKNRSSDTTNNALAGALYTYTDSNKAFQHIHNGTPLFTILSGGSVGIGTSAPSQKLDVSGIIKSGVAGNSSANYASLLVTSAGEATTQAGIGIQQATTEGDTIIFCDYEPYVEYNFMHENSTNQFMIHGGGSTNNLGSNTFYNRSGNARTGYIKHVFNQDNGNMFVGGSVGIGTSSPAYRLQLGNLTSTSTATPETLSLGGTYSNSAGSNIKLKVYDDGAAAGGMSVSAGQMEVNTWSSGKIAFYRGTTQTAIIDANGDVGIANSSPLGGVSSGLTIGGIGSVKCFNIGMQNTYGRIRERDQIDALAITTNINDSGTQDSSTRSSWKLRMGWGNGQDNFLISRSPVASNTFADLFYIKSDGNVGVGTTAPLSKLNSYGSGSNLSVFRVDGGNGTLFEVTDQLSGSLFSVNDVSGLPLLEVFSNNRIVAGKYGSNALVVSGSSVGIGTTTPAYKLQVNGSFAATTKSFVIQHPDPNKSDKQLVHGVLEGPEHSVFVRGILKDTNIIQLPDYWQHLVHEDSVSVTLTSNKYYQQLYVKNVTLTTIEVGSETDKPINCYYYIVGERKDIDKLVPEI